MSAVILPRPVEGGDADDSVASERAASERAARPSPAKWIAGGLSVLMIALVLWPIVENWREQPQDSYPLSYYRKF